MPTTEYYLFYTPRFQQDIDGPVNVTATTPRRAAEKLAKLRDVEGTIYVCEDLVVVDVLRKVNYHLTVNPGSITTDREEDED